MPPFPFRKSKAGTTSAGALAGVASVGGSTGALSGRGSSSGDHDSDADEAAARGLELEPVAGGGAAVARTGSRALDRLSDSTAALLHTLGFGGVLGACTGYALKQTAKVAAVFVGGTVVFLQMLQYYEVIEIRWDTVRRGVTYLFDADGDGSLSLNDVRVGVRRFFHVLLHRGPSAGASFAGGIYLGLRM